LANSIPVRVWKERERERERESASARRNQIIERKEEKKKSDGIMLREGDKTHLHS
jgi:hypothetical protein